MDLSEPERAKARYQIVLSSLLAPGREASLFAYSPSEARLQIGTDARDAVPVLAQVLLATADEAPALQPRLKPLLDELLASRLGQDGRRFYLRIVVIVPPAEADALDRDLRALAAQLPDSPVIQIFVVQSDGKVRSASSTRMSEIGAALREQEGAALTLLPEAEFAARCEQAIQKTKVQVGEVAAYAQAMQSRRVPVTYGLLALQLLMFALSYLWGGPEQIATLGRMGAAAPDRISAGEWWRLLSATALHGGLMHLLFNSLALRNLGTLMEKLLGPARFLTLYVLSGLAGSLLGTALGGLTHFRTSVGASGAICGLLGACAALAVRPRGELPVLIAQSLKRMALLNLMLTAFGSLNAQVDWVAHLGGAIGGAALVLSGLLRPPAPKEGSAAPTRQGVHALLGAVSAGALLLSVGLALLRGQPWVLSRPELRQRVVLPGTPISLEVPRSLGSGQPGTKGEGTTSLLFDDPLQSALDLAIVAEPNAQPLSTPEERAREAKAQWPPLLAAAHAADPNTAARELTVAGLPVLSLTRSWPSGDRLQLLVQLRANYKLLLKLSIPRSTRQRMVPDLQSLLETVRDEPR